MGGGTLRYLPILILCISCGNDPAQPAISCEHFRGVDVLAVTHDKFPCDRLDVILKDVTCPALGFVWDTFGTNRECVEHFIAEHKDVSHLIRIHLTNESWRDDGREGFEGDLFLDLSSVDLNKRIERRDDVVLSTLRRRISEVVGWIDHARNANTRIVLSSGLEDVYSDDAYRIVRKLISEQFHETIIRNPLSSLAEDANEVHGAQASCGDHVIVSSEDGAIADNADDSLFLNRGRDCLSSFIWRPEWQGRVRDGSGGIAAADSEPRQRDIKISETEAKRINETLRETL